MAAEINAPEKNQNLSDLQSTYERKKREVREKGERELQQLKEDYKAKTIDERFRDEAAINHIDKARKSQAEFMTAQNQEKMKESEEVVSKNIEKQQEAEKRQQKKINEARKTYSGKVDKEQEQLQSRLADVEENGEKKEKAEVLKFNKTREEYDREMNNLVKNNEKKLIDTRDQGSARVEEEMKTDTEQHNKIRKNAQKNMSDEKIKRDEQLKKYKQTSEQEFSQQQNVDHQKVDVQRDLYRKEAAKVDQDGYTEIKNEKTRFDVTKNKQKEQEEADLTHDKQLFQGRVDKLHATEQENLTINQKDYDARTEQQKQHFISKYQKTEDQNKLTLLAQKENILRALRAQQEELLKKVKSYGNVQNDPFYSLVDYESNLQDTGKAYIFSTQIPEYDKDNVSVRVHNDKVVLTGNRSFEDKVDQTDKKLETNSYQSFHEEYKLDRPVKQNDVTQIYENGILSVYIPKV